MYRLMNLVQNSVCAKIYKPED